MTSILITTCLLTIGLLFVTPVQEVEQPSWPASNPVAPIAVFAPAISSFDYSTLPTPEVTPPLFALTESPAPPAEPPPLTPAELVDSIFGWPGRQLVQCESGWNQWAVGAAGEKGPLQIHPVHKPLVARMGYSWEDMHQWEPNLRVAVEIRRTQGLRAWTCWRG